METTRILILGASGMLGHKLFLQLSRQEGFDVYATARSLDGLSACLSPELLSKIHLNVDGNNFDTIVRSIALTKPDLLINCIGIIKQVPAAQDHLVSIYTNALLPHRIALACHTAGVRMIHISTDCVFNGSQGNYTEDDIPNCVDLYGRTKLLGEVNYPHCLTIRTSIIGHELKGKFGLIEWFLAQEDKIQGYTRHIYSGFPTTELASIIAKYIVPNPQLNGIYHLSAAPISKYELLKLIACKYKKEIEIEPFDNVHCDRSLDSSKLQQLIGYSPPSWPELIDNMYLDFLATQYSENNREEANVNF